MANTLRRSSLDLGAIVAAALLVGAAACGNNSESANSEASKGAAMTPRISSVPFGQTADGTGIDLITLRNQKGVEIRVMTYGGIILSIKTPDRDGNSEDITLGYDTAAEYFKNPTYFGVLVGRYANRIANAKFTLDGKTYTLPANNGVNSLHGGAVGWDQKVWHAEPFQNGGGVGVALSLTSPDGDQGYPGEVKATVTYTLTDDSRLIVDYDATTNAPTVINMTQHTYFNLAGSKANDILGHELTINADRYTPVDDTLIPTGTLAPVDGTPFDFRMPTKIGARIDQKDEQLIRGKGYDHNWVLNRNGDGLSQAAIARDPISGRTVEISTTEPGIQFYSGNFLDGTNIGKGGKAYPHRSGFCLETQHYPDSPNQPSFPSTVLRPGGRYTSQTVFKFGTDK
jgi:aldose 1-epimerase